MVGEIAEVLLGLGGAAHRESVIESLHANRFARGVVNLNLRARAVAVFDAHSTSGARSLFRKPFGPGLNRWALTPEAEAFLRAGVAAKAVRPQPRLFVVRSTV